MANEMQKRMITRSVELQELVAATADILDTIQPPEMREIFENKLSAFLTTAYVDMKLLAGNARAACDISRYLATEWRIRKL